MAEVYYRLKSAGGPFTRVVGTSPIEVTGLTDGEIYEYAQGDDTLAEIMPGVAPSVVTAPTITGAFVGSTPVVNAGTYGGLPAPTVTPGTLELDGVAFDPPTELQPADDGKTLTYTGETASNGIAPDATQSVTVTVGANYLLDRYPGAAQALSLRQLASGITHVARVRRSSDNVEDDFTAPEITNGALTTWVGAGNDGFVVTLYDQSGNGRHSTQATANSQMKIVDGGTLVTENGKPILLHDGVDDGFSFTPPALIDDLLVICVQTVTDLAASRILSMSATDNDDFKPDGLIIGESLFGFGDVTGQTSDANRLDTPVPPLNQLYIRSHQKNSTALNVRENGSVIVSKSPITMTLSTDRAAIGYAVQDGPGTSPWIGTMGDLIVYTSDESANLTAIEQDVADYYGIPLA